VVPLLEISRQQAETIQELKDEIAGLKIAAVRSDLPRDPDRHGTICTLLRCNGLVSFSTVNKS